MEALRAPKTQPIPRSIKSGYGLAELGITATQIITQLYLLEFYTQTVGLNASLAGIALALSVLWDGVSDPLMGVLSDRTESRWGRRRPYIAVGSVFLGLTIGLLFSPPNCDEQWLLFAYLLGTYLTVNTAMTVLSVPHLALGGELSAHPPDRTEIFGWRLLYSNLGILLGMVVPAVLLEALVGGSGMGSAEISPETNADSLTVANTYLATARALSAWGIGALVAVSGLATFWITGSPSLPKKEHLTHNSKFSLLLLVRNFREVLQNPIFLPLLLAFVIATFGRTFNTAIALFYYKFRLGLTESQVVLGILFPFFVIIILSIPFWIRIANRFGKKYPAFFGVFLLGLSTAIAYPLYPYGNPYYPLITAVIGGICAGSIFLLDSLVADTVDYDELKTGEMKEGLFFGFWKMATKFAQAIGLAVSGFLLDAIGFQPGSSSQSEEVTVRLAWIFGPGVGVFFILGSLVFLYMPLNRELSTRIAAILEKKRKQRSQNGTQPINPRW